MKIKIIGTLIAFILCFPLHFLYDKFPSFITSIFLPVNESIWEHMKILFGSIIISAVIQKIIIEIKKEKINNFWISNFIGALSSIPVFLIIFIPIYHLIGENLPITLIIMLISIMISEIISYIITEKKDLNQEKKTILYIIIVYIIFSILTYYPIKIELFKDPTNNTYGIKQK